MCEEPKLAEVQAEIEALRIESAERIVRALPAGGVKDTASSLLLRARASDPRLDQNKRAQLHSDASRLIAKTLLTPEYRLYSTALRACLGELVKWAFPGSGDERSADPENFVKRFYFERGRKDVPPGLDAVLAKAELTGELRRQRTLESAAYGIQFLKRFSSFTPILSRSDAARFGGGYFAYFGDYGCVIDPGHHFLDNFFRANRSLFDIDGICVTHFHDDHYADLPALLSLLYQRHKQEPQAKVDLYLDATTSRMFEPLISSGAFGGERVVLTPGPARSIRRAPGVSMRPIRTRHSILGENTGVGLVFDVTPKETRLVVTGDTSWDDEIAELYRSLRHQQCVLVGHVSTVDPVEIYGALFGDTPGFYRNHLGIRGLAHAIAALRPSHVALSEVGEELRNSIEQLAELVEFVFPCSCTVAWEEYPCTFPPARSAWEVGATGRLLRSE